MLKTETETIYIAIGGYHDHKRNFLLHHIARVVVLHLAESVKFKLYMYGISQLSSLIYIHD